MNPVVILLVCESLATLALGFYAWTLTSSRSIIFNTLFGSAGILFAAYLAASRQQLPLAVGIPFIVAMMFAGRGGALLYRSGADAQLRKPALLLLAVAGSGFSSSIFAYVML